MFAGLYPLISVICFIYTLIKMRADAIKLCTVYQRPRPFRTGGIAPWDSIIMVQVGWSTVTSAAQIHSVACSCLDVWKVCWGLITQMEVCDGGHAAKCIAVKMNGVGVAHSDATLHEGCTGHCGSFFFQTICLLSCTHGVTCWLNLCAVVPLYSLTLCAAPSLLQVCLSVIINVFLSGISTHQLSHLLPMPWRHYKHPALDLGIGFPGPIQPPRAADSTLGNQLHLQHPSAKPVLSPDTVSAYTPAQLLLLFGLEHVLFVVLLLIQVCIPGEPAEVRAMRQKVEQDARQLEAIERRRSITNEFSMSHKGSMSGAVARHRSFSKDPLAEWPQGVQGE